MKTLIFLYPDQFEKLERGEAIEVSFPIKHFWTKRILNWAAKSDESNSNIAQVQRICTKQTLLIKIIEIKATIKDDKKIFSLTLELFNDR